MEEDVKKNIYINVSVFIYIYIHIYIYIYIYIHVYGSDGKESACNAGDLGSILESVRFPGEGNSYPLQCSCLDNSMDRGGWRATAHGVTRESHTTERLILSLFIVQLNHCAVHLKPTQYCKSTMFQ